jgi:hypothetical protein
LGLGISIFVGPKLFSFQNGVFFVVFVAVFQEGGEQSVIGGLKSGFFVYCFWFLQAGCALTIFYKKSVQYQPLKRKIQRVLNKQYELEQIQGRAEVRRFNSVIIISRDFLY